MTELHLHCLAANGSDAGILGRDLVIADFPCVVGRHTSCDRCLNISLISRHHCSFFRRGAEVWVEDLGSRNGTWVNGEPITGACPLHDGDQLELARLPFRVDLCGAEASPEEPEVCGRPVEEG
jgi:predicted component of type VI protein secretion system